MSPIVNTLAFLDDGPALVSGAWASNDGVEVHP